MEDKRQKPVSTKRGIILYKTKNDDWKIDYPNGDYRYGRATTRKLVNFILLLNEGKTIDQADEIAFEIEGKYKKQ